MNEDEKEKRYNINTNIQNPENHSEYEKAQKNHLYSLQTDDISRFTG